MRKFAINHGSIKVREHAANIRVLLYLEAQQTLSMSGYPGTQSDRKMWTPMNHKAVCIYTPHIHTAHIHRTYTPHIHAAHTRRTYTRRYTHMLTYIHKSTPTQTSGEADRQVGMWYMRAIYLPRGALKRRRGREWPSPLRRAAPCMFVRSLHHSLILSITHWIIQFVDRLVT